MIVFNFGPYSKDELTIRFDREGVTKFLDAILSLLNQAIDTIAIECLQCTGPALDAAQIVVRRDDENFLKIRSGKLTLCMSEDAFEYAKFLLERFFSEGDFSPAEFYAFSRKGRKYDTQVFFLKLSGAEK